MNSVKDYPISSERRVTDASLKHLYAELARLDILLQRQVNRWQAAGQDPNDSFRGLYISDIQVQQLIRRPVGEGWGDSIHGDETGVLEALKAAEMQAQALSKRADKQEKSLRFNRLVEMFSLTRFEKDLLLLALAPTIDLRYQKIFGYLQDDVTKKAPTANLALELFSSPDDRSVHLRAFNPDANLYRNQILHKNGPEKALLDRPLILDPAITAWLLGHFYPEGLVTPEEDPGETSDLDAQIPVYDPHLILSFTGADQQAQRTATEIIASRTEKPLLIVDVSQNEEPSLQQAAIRRRLRDARLMNAIPVFTHWDALLDHDAPPRPIVKLLLDYPDMVVVRSREIWRPRGVPRTRRIHRVEFPIPKFRTRLTQWKRLLEDHPDMDALDLPHLAGQFALTTGQIRDAYEAALDTAVQRRSAIEAADLLAAARSHSNPRLGSLARKIDPRFDWNDIILPREQITILQEITSTVRQQPKVLDDWGVGKKLTSSRGVTVLFAGPPGTGKTMAAEIMAHDLGLDLYKIDLSGVVSKYIGETEKNLEKVFEEAASSNAILFFDEADALFGKRSEVRDAHDRYANLEISYLLQKMEAYDGVTILATNLRANLDEAFTRRLQFAVDFPFPEASDRFRIWCALFPPDVPREDALDFDLMARRFKLAGGNIRNVIVTAAYLAAADGGTVTMGHMLHATRRELQKMGRLVDEADLKF